MSFPNKGNLHKKLIININKSTKSHRHQSTILRQIPGIGSLEYPRFEECLAATELFLCAFHRLEVVPQLHGIRKTSPTLTIPQNPLVNREKTNITTWIDGLPFSLVVYSLGLKTRSPPAICLFDGFRHCLVPGFQTSTLDVDSQILFGQGA